MSTYAMFRSHKRQGSQLHHHGPDPRASPHCLETKGVQAPSLYIPQPRTCSILDGARNVSDLNPAFLAREGRPLLPGTRCAAGPVSTKMGLGLWAPLLPSPASRWAWFLPKRDEAMEEDGCIVTSGLNAARNQKPTEHVCLAAQTLLQHLAKTVLIANSTDSTAYLILQICPSISML